MKRIHKTNEMKVPAQIILLLFLMWHGGAIYAQKDSVNFGIFGNVYLYHPSQQPKSAVLFVSGDGGWNLGVVEMARILSKEGALVAGIDIQRYYRNMRKQKANCYYPAADFESLSLFLQKELKLPQYFKPVLLGYSSGATLVYGILAQAPANTFKGAIALGFCPDIEINKPLCRGSGLQWHDLVPGKSYYLEALAALSAPFVSLQGMIDQVCSFGDAKKYFSSLKNAELVALPKVGHGFSVEVNWVPQFKDAYHRILSAPSFTEQKNEQNKLLQEQHLDPLPLEMPLALLPAAVNDSLPVVLMISGDGGWTSFDQSLAEKLAEKGMPVIGLDAQRYFWNGKTPEETTEDIAATLEHFMQQWKRKTFQLAGYSFGANVVPFVANRLPDRLKSVLRGIIMLSPDITADFEIHVDDMLSLGMRTEKFNVPREMVSLAKLKPECIFGDEEDPETREAFVAVKCKINILPGSHHYNEDYQKLAEVFFSSLR